MSELEPGQGQPTNVSDGFTDKQQIKMESFMSSININISSQDCRDFLLNIRNSS